MANPLGLLRQYNVNKKDIGEHGNQIIFGEFSWPKDVKTNYLITRKKGSIKEYYTLECLLYFLKNINLFHPDYVTQAAAANIQAVRRPDRKKLLAYLNGETTICDSIDKGAPLEIPIQVKRTFNHYGEPVVKKPRIEDTHVQKFRQHVAANLDAPKEASVSVDDIKRLGAMADPLSLLRQYNVNKKDIGEHGNQIIFGEVSWPKDVKTNYLITRKKGSIKEYYTLECLLFFLKNINLFHPDYVTQAAAANIQAVRRPDRKKLLAYLNGETTICDSIDKGAPLEIPIQNYQQGL